MSIGTSTCTRLINPWFSLIDGGICGVGATFAVAPGTLVRELLPYRRRLNRLSIPWEHALSSIDFCGESF